MDKLPAKQIYLLLVIILGIIGLSIYSTYSIFTLEAESTDIVSIRTPSNLSVNSSRYEYKQVTVAKNGYISTDIDIYNNLDYTLCYSIWYKIASKNIDNTKVKIYQNTDGSVLTSSTIEPVTSRRINLLIVNDNNTDVKVNIGLSHAQNEETCELNLESDKLLITETINNPKVLSDTLIKDVKTENNEAGYLTYKDNPNEIKFGNEDKIYVASKFTYKDELFTLTEPKEITRDKLNEYNNSYTCLDKDNCEFLYYITEVKLDEEIDEVKYYKITKYDRLVGYLASEIGLRKITNDDYYFYGDNPNNYILYNCKNDKDVKTCELWRIIGFVYDSKENKYLTKIVRNAYLDVQEFDDDSNAWDDSTIAKYFSKYKLNNANTITEIKFKEENVVDLDINLNNIPLLDKEYKGNISLIKLSDYLYTSACTKEKMSEYDEKCLKNNWLNLNSSTFEWTLTTKYEEPYKDEETEEMITPDNDKRYVVGNEITLSKYDEKLNVRPVVYLKSRTLVVSGNGTFSNPYVIK